MAAASRYKRVTTNLDQFFGDLPWGVVVFVAIAIGGLFWTLHDQQALRPGEYLGAVASGAGLLAVGHGIRTRRRD